VAALQGNSFKCRRSNLKIHEAVKPDGTWKKLKEQVSQQKDLRPVKPDKSQKSVSGGARKEAQQEMLAAQSPAPGEGVCRNTRSTCPVLSTTKPGEKKVSNGKQNLQNATEVVVRPKTGY